MQKILQVLLIAVTVTLIGCSTTGQVAANQITYPPSEGTAYLDAAREVIAGQGWSIVSEQGSTKASRVAEEEEVTITGQTADGKKVYFTARGTSAPHSTYLEVTTEDGFPLSPERIVDLVKREYRN